MENGTPVEVALIGDGRRGRLLCRVLAEMPRVRRIHLVSQRSARAMHDWLAAERLAHRVELHAKLDPVLWNRDIAAAVVANQPAEHFATARWLLENGKHVLVEHPLAQTRAEAQVLIDLAAARGLMAEAALSTTDEQYLALDYPREPARLAAEIARFLEGTVEPVGVLALRPREMSPTVAGEAG